MICPVCFGRKYDFKKDGNSGYFVECKKCHGTGVVEPQTNEEWFNGLATEEKAKVLRRKTYGNSEDNEAIEQGWANWLKAKHEDNPPDIPSVPSWDKWLQGEKTKCEYCDGTNAECNLAGRFECPRTPKTEQEYIQTCDTEQLAEVLADVSLWIHPFMKQKNRFELLKKQFYEWLKQPHTDKE